MIDLDWGPLIEGGIPCPAILFWPTFRKVFVASAFGIGAFLIPNGVQSATSNSATPSMGRQSRGQISQVIKFTMGQLLASYGSPTECWNGPPPINTRT